MVAKTSRFELAKVFFALMAVFSVLFITNLMSDTIGERTFLLLYPTVFFCSMLAGFLPGLAATVVSAIGAWYFFIPYRYSFEMPSSTDAFGLFVFSTTGVALSFYSRKLKQTNDSRLEALENLRVSKEAAETANVAKGQFLANMSHEIRTPLGVILGFAELAQDSGAHPEETQTYLNIIKRNGQQLNQILGDILDLSKMEANKLQIEHMRFPLQSFLEELVASMEVSARNRGIVLSLETPLNLPSTIRTDPTRLRQILLNLIGNAVKFSDSGCVIVSVRMLSEGIIGIPVRLEFSVTDTGIGIPAEVQQKLFQPFSQADSSSTRQYGGTGLGLMLSRKLTQALGGDLILRQSIVGVGSSFAFSIDAGPYDGSVYHQDNNNKSNSYLVVSENPTEYKILADKNVLVVEDSKDNQALVGHILKTAGMKVHFAINGLDGIEKIETGHYDIVLMDLQMPVMDGREATKILRARGYTRPIVAWTAHALEHEKRMALEQGFSEFLTKPINKKDLLDTLRHFVEV